MDWKKTQELQKLKFHTVEDRFRLVEIRNEEESEFILRFMFSDDLLISELKYDL